MASEVPCYDWQMGKSMLQCNDYMFTHQVACDITFHVHYPEEEEETISAHKYILIARSPVFCAMLCGEMATDNINIVDINPTILQTLLRYLYTDDVSLTQDNAFLLLYAAKKYLIQTLIEECIQYLKGVIAEENACHIYQQSVVFQDKEVEVAAVEFIEENTDKVAKTVGFRELPLELLSQIVKNDKLSIYESDLILAVLEWARGECKRRDMTENGETLRSVLGEALYDLRFPVLTDEEFLGIVRDSDIVNGEEILSVIKSIKYEQPEQSRFKVDERTGSLTINVTHLNDVIVLPASSYGYILLVQPNETVPLKYYKLVKPTCFPLQSSSAKMSVEPSILEQISSIRCDRRSMYIRKRNSRDVITINYKPNKLSRNSPKSNKEAEISVEDNESNIYLSPRNRRHFLYRFFKDTYKFLQTIYPDSEFTESLRIQIF